MTNQTCSAKEIAEAIIEGTERVLQMQDSVFAINFLNGEMVTLMGMIIDGEIEHDTGHAAYKVLREVRSASYNGFKLERMLRKAKEAAAKL